MRRSTKWWIVAVVESVAVALLIAALLGTDAPLPERSEGRDGDSARREDARRTSTSDERDDSTSDSARRADSPTGEVRTAWRYDPEDPVGLIVTGSIRDPEGRLVRHAHAKFVSADQRANGRQGEQSFYRVVGLTPGTWQVSASCGVGDWRDTQTTLELGDDRPHTTLDLTLHPADTARLFLVDEADEAWLPSYESLGVPPPFDGAQLRVHVVGSTAVLADRVDYRTLDQPLHAEVLRNDPAQAFCTLRASEPLPLQLSVMLGDRVLARSEWPKESTEIQVPLHRDALRGALAQAEFQVVDKVSRSPLAGATVGHRHIALRADTEGRVRLTGLVPGDWQLYAQAEDYAIESRHFDIPPGSGPVHLFEMSRPRTVSGTVLNPDGSAQPHARLSLTPLDRFDAPVRYWADQDGSPIGETARFEWTVGSGRALLRAYDHEKGTTTVLVDTTSGPIEDLEVRLRPTHLVKLRSDGPRYLVVRDRDGQPFFWDRVWSDVEVWLPVGTWQVESHGANGLQGRFALSVPVPDATPIALP